MKPQMLIVADYATAAPITGKLTIVGAFNYIHPQKYPHIHPRFAIAIKLVAGSPLETTGPRDIDIQIVSEDGVDLWQAQCVVQLPHDGKGNRRDANIIFELNNMRFPGPGVYEVIVKEERKKIGDTTIQLVQI